MIEEYTKAQYGPETVPVGEPLFNVGLGWDYVLVHKFKNQGVDVLAKSGGTLQYNSQLYVLPKEHISVAVIFAGLASPTAVADAILQALLEEKGIVKNHHLIASSYGMLKFRIVLRTMRDFIPQRWNQEG
jgi:hypothetical protein